MNAQSKQRAALPFDLHVTGFGRDHQNQVYLEIGVKHAGRKPKLILLHADQVHPEGSELKAALGRAGIHLLSGSRSRSVLELLQREVDKIDTLGRPDFYVGSRAGWKNGRFITPYRVYKAKSVPGIIPILDHERPERWRPTGKLGQWKRIAELAGRGNPMVIFAACTAFVPPLLEFIDRDGFGIMVVGDSSTGRTTLSHFSASVWGGDSNSHRGFLGSWNSTINNLERVAAEFRNCYFVPDDTKEIEGGIGSPQAAGNLAQAIFKFVGGVTKGRMTDVVVPSEWQIVYWATSNQTTKEILESGKKDWDASYAARLVEIPADRMYGVFDHIPGSVAELGNSEHHKRRSIESPGQFADWIREAVRNVYGDPIDHYLNKLVHWRATNKKAMVKWLRRCVKKIKREMRVDTRDGVQDRKATHFAAIYAAGCLASKAGAIPWSAEEIEAAILDVFEAHCRFVTNKHYGRGIIEKLHSYIRANRHNFVDATNGPSEYDRDKLELAPGFITRTRNGPREFSFLPETFQKIVGGDRVPALVDALRRGDLLVHDRGRSPTTCKSQTKRQVTRGRRGDDGRRRVYCVRDRILRTTQPFDARGDVSQLSTW